MTNLLLVAHFAFCQSSAVTKNVNVDAQAGKLDEQGKQAVQISLDISEKHFVYCDSKSDELTRTRLRVDFLAGDKILNSTIPFPPGDVFDGDFADLTVYRGKVVINATVQRDRNDLRKLVAVVRLHLSAETY